MVTQLPNEERWEAVEVTDIQGEYQGDVIADNNGNLQYRIQCKFSWSLYPVTVYVYRDNCPNPFNVGSYNALVKRASLLPKHNNASDPQEYMFRHYITEWESIGQPAPAPQEQLPNKEQLLQASDVAIKRDGLISERVAPAPQVEPKPVADIFAGIDQNQMRIMRQATLKCASWMMVPLMKDFSSPLLAVKRTEELSELFLEYVVTGKVYEDIPEDAEDLLNEDPFA